MTAEYLPVDAERGEDELPSSHADRHPKQKALCTLFLLAWRAMDRDHCQPIVSKHEEILTTESKERDEKPGLRLLADVPLLCRNHALTAAVIGTEGIRSKAASSRNCC